MAPSERAKRGSGGGDPGPERRRGDPRALLRLARESGDAELERLLLERLLPYDRPPRRRCRRVRAALVDELCRRHGLPPAPAPGPGHYDRD